MAAKAWGRRLGMEGLSKNENGLMDIDYSVVIVEWGMRYKGTKW